MVGLERAERDVPLVAQMQEIGAYLLLGELIGRAHVICGQRADGLEVIGLGSSRQPGQCHVLDHTLTQRCHLAIPFEVQSRTHVPALEKILPSHTHCDRRSRYGEAVRSNLHF